MPHYRHGRHYAASAHRPAPPGTPPAVPVVPAVPAVPGAARGHTARRERRVYQRGGHHYARQRTARLRRAHAGSPGSTGSTGSTGVSAVFAAQLPAHSCAARAPTRCALRFKARAQRGLCCRPLFRHAALALRLLARPPRTAAHTPVLPPRAAHIVRHAGWPDRPFCISTRPLPGMRGVPAASQFCARRSRRSPASPRPRALRRGGRLH